MLFIQEELTRGDIKVLGSGNLFTFRRSKVDKFGIRVHRVVAIAVPGMVLYPKATVQETLSMQC